MIFSNNAEVYELLQERYALCDPYCVNINFSKYFIKNGIIAPQAKASETFDSVQKKSAAISATIMATIAPVFPALAIVCFSYFFIQKYIM